MTKINTFHREYYREDLIKSSFDEDGNFDDALLEGLSEDKKKELVYLLKQVYNPKLQKTKKVFGEKYKIYVSLIVDILKDVENEQLSRLEVLLRHSSEQLVKNNLANGLDDNQIT